MRGKKMKSRTDSTRFMAKLLTGHSLVFLFLSGYISINKRRCFCQLNKSWAEILPIHFLTAFIPHLRVRYSFMHLPIARAPPVEIAHLCKSIEDFMSNHRTHETIQKMTKPTENRVGYAIQCYILWHLYSGFINDKTWSASHEMNWTTSTKWSLLVIHDSWQR